MIPPRLDEGSERGAFEAWFRKEYHDRLCRNMPDKSYNDPAAYSMWIAWKASRAALSTGRLGGEWLPIESAPKDGTRFLAACDTGLVRLVRWDDKWDRFPIGDEPGGCWPTAPAYYMPLPPAPAAKPQGDSNDR